MLQKTILLIFVLASCLQFAAPSRLQAIDQSIVINEVQTGATNDPGAEFVELYNSSDSEIIVDGWQLEYISASGKTTTVLITLKGKVKARGYILISHEVYLNEADSYFNNTLSKGILAKTSGHIRLVDKTATTVDILGWGDAALAEHKAAPVSPDDQSLSRQSNDTNNNNADFMITERPTPQGGDLYTDDSIEPSKPITYASIYITELFPNPTPPLLDANDEFIELYNPNNHVVDLTNYVLQTGSNFEYRYVLPASTIDPGQYIALYAHQTNLVLTNTSSKARLLDPNAKVLSDTPAYSNIRANESWSLINKVWQASNLATPGEVNQTGTQATLASNTNHTACSEGKYRHPETGRCRTIEEPADQITCPSGQVRSASTNRCRKLTTATTSIAPCQIGYERNLTTNRCRKITPINNPATACAPGQERNLQTNRCRKIQGASTTAASVKNITGTKQTNAYGWLIGVVGIGAVSYAIYEWRQEIITATRRLHNKFQRRGT